MDYGPIAHHGMCLDNHSRQARIATMNQNQKPSEGVRSVRGAGAKMMAAPPSTGKIGAFGYWAFGSVSHLGFCHSVLTPQRHKPR